MNNRKPYPFLTFEKSHDASVLRIPSYFARREN